MRATLILAPATLGLLFAACGESSPSLDDLNKNSVVTGTPGTTTDSSAATSSVTSGAGNVTSGGVTAAVNTASSTTGSGGAGMVGTVDTNAANTASVTSTVGGVTNTVTSATGSGGAMSTTETVTTDGGGTGGTGPVGPYDPRSGPFNMLVYSKIGPNAFRHDSISAGQAMLQDIADEWGFNVTITDTNELITAEGLAQFEVVFFMNCTGDIFNSQEEAAFEAWVKNNGAFVGVHSATDTESGWAFYKELTGQYYDGHGMQDTPGSIILEQGASTHPAVAGIPGVTSPVPNPWNRNEEWYNFNSYQQWQNMPGLQVLGRKQADNQPIVWAREHDNYRSFYTALGHASAVFRDPVFIDHITGGIMWAARRDHLSPPLQ